MPLKNNNRSYSLHILMIFLNGLEYYCKYKQQSLENKMAVNIYRKPSQKGGE